MAMVKRVWRRVTDRKRRAATAARDMGRVKSCSGKMSILSLPNSSRISSMSTEARRRMLPSAGSISTRMSMSLSSCAVSRATEPNSRGAVEEARQDRIS